MSFLTEGSALLLVLRPRFSHFSSQLLSRRNGLRTDGEDDEMMKRIRTNVSSLAALAKKFGVLFSTHFCKALRVTCFIVGFDWVTELLGICLFFLFDNDGSDTARCCCFCDGIHFCMESGNLVFIEHGVLGGINCVEFLIVFSGLLLKKCGRMPEPNKTNYFTSYRPLRNAP